MTLRRADGLVLLAAIFVALLSNAPLSVLCIAATGIAIFGLLRGVPGHGVLLIPICFQVLQVTIKPVVAVLSGQELNDLSDYGTDLESAFFFSLAAISLMVFGVRIACMGHGQQRSRQGAAGVTDWPMRGTVALALVLIVAGNACLLLASGLGGLYQLALAIANVKYAGLFLLAHHALRFRRHGLLLAGIVAFEILIGMTGYFGQFRLALVSLAAAAWFSGGFSSLRQAAAFSLLAAMGVALAVFWSAVKSDYRAFLNHGVGDQVVLRAPEERLDYLWQAGKSLDRLQYQKSIEELIGRLSYIDLLSATMESVPDGLPHESGARLMGAVRHIFMPRLFFPEKPPLESDSRVTTYYTGIEIAGEHTSVSLGYLAELYIDFGLLGALALMAVLGLVYGWVFRKLVTYPRLPQSFNTSLLLLITLPLALFETALVKVVGAVATGGVAVVLLQRVIVLLFPVSSPLMRGRLGAAR